MDLATTIHEETAFRFSVTDSLHNFADFPLFFITIISNQWHIISHNVYNFYKYLIDSHSKLIKFLRYLQGSSILFLVKALKDLCSCKIRISGRISRWKSGRIAARELPFKKITFSWFHVTWLKCVGSHCCHKHF